MVGSARAGTAAAAVPINRVEDERVDPIVGVRRCGVREDGG